MFQPFAWPHLRPIKKDCQAHFVVDCENNLCKSYAHNQVSAIPRIGFCKKVKMAFTLIEKSINRLSSRVAVTDVRMMKSAKNGCVQVSIALPIVASLGWGRGDKVQVEAGAGDDDGWLRVTRSSSGYKIGRYGDNDKRLTFSCAGILRHLKNFPTVSCRHVVVNNALLVEIPARLRGATLSVAA